MSSAIVETPEVRERTRLGMWFFLASEVMFFAGFIGAYVVIRSTHPFEFERLHIELSKWFAGINTIVLITSSLTMALAVSAAHRGDNKWCARMLLATMLLGCTFLGIKGVEYSHHLEEGIVKKGTPEFVALSEWDKVHDVEEETDDAGNIKRPAETPGYSIMYACYYTMTGFHGLHVLVGVFVLFVLWINALRGKYSVDRNVGVEVSGLYWHLVDVIWIFLFPIVYLI